MCSWNNIQNVNTLKFKLNLKNAKTLSVNSVKNHVRIDWRKKITSSDG